MTDIEKKLREEVHEWIAAWIEYTEADTPEQVTAAYRRLEEMRIGNGDFSMPPEIKRSLLDQLDDERKKVAALEKKVRRGERAEAAMLELLHKLGLDAEDPKCVPPKSFERAFNLARAVYKETK